MPRLWWILLVHRRSRDGRIIGQACQQSNVVLSNDQADMNLDTIGTLIR